MLNITLKDICDKERKKIEPLGMGKYLMKNTGEEIEICPMAEIVLNELCSNLYKTEIVNIIPKIEKSLFYKFFYNDKKKAKHINEAIKKLKLDEAVAVVPLIDRDDMLSFAIVTDKYNNVVTIKDSEKKKSIDLTGWYLGGEILIDKRNRKTNYIDEFFK